ncbi:hypothetical protein EQV77_06665 [Halobacillus fulvus]|nr:hypothetical protein EQV77_06665 [Halobacillus fulvus]
MTQNKKMNKSYGLALLVVWGLFTLDTFFIEATWFDWVFYPVTLIAIGIFALYLWRDRKTVLTIVAGLVFLLYAYEFVQMVF